MLFTWGSNSHGQLGLRKDYHLLSLPQIVTMLVKRQSHMELEKVSDKVVLVSAGAYHSCFVTERGSLYGCGSNIYSQLLGSPSRIVQGQPAVFKNANIIKCECHVY